MPEETLPKDYINKEATQQAELVKIYPEFDGRGRLIAILDTGVDLSFDGMQKTSTGLPKVIDSFDFTGAGNVDTSVVKTIGSDNVIEGLTGRLLKVNTCKKDLIEHRFLPPLFKEISESHESSLAEISGAWIELLDNEERKKFVQLLMNHHIFDTVCKIIYLFLINIITLRVIYFYIGCITFLENLIFNE